MPVLREVLGLLPKTGGRHACPMAAIIAASSMLSLGAQTNGYPEFRAETAREYLRVLARVVTEQTGTNIEGIFSLARIQSQLGEKQEAERLARAALETDPGRSDISIFLADMLIRQDRMKDAAECLKLALARNARTEGGWRRLGMVLDRMGDAQGAQAAFNSAVEQAPGDAHGWLLRGKAFLDAGKYAEAVADLEKAVRLDPDLDNAYYPLFQAQSKQGNQEAAQKALKRFRELKQAEKASNGTMTERPTELNDPAAREVACSVHKARAGQLLREGKTASAEEHVRQGLKLSPRDPEFHEMLAQVCVQQQRLTEAQTHLEEVVRLRPAAAGARANLGTLLLGMKDYTNAVRELKRGLELDPKNPEILHNLARYQLTSRSDLPEALMLSRRLVEVDPSAASYDLLGWACYSNGKTNEAIAASQAAVQKDPGNALYASRLQRLRKLVGQ